jgi:hypothetical protein
MTTHHYSEKTGKFSKTRSRFVIAMQSVSQSVIAVSPRSMLTTFICHQFVTWVMLSLSDARSTCSSSSSSITYTQNNLRVCVLLLCVCVREREGERERDDYVSMWISIPRDNNPKSSLLFSKSKIMHSDLLGTLTSFGHTTLSVCAVVSVRGLFFPPSMTGIFQCCTGISEQSGS